MAAIPPTGMFLGGRWKLDSLEESDMGTEMTWTSTNKTVQGYNWGPEINEVATLPIASPHP